MCSEACLVGFGVEVEVVVVVGALGTHYADGHRWVLRMDVRRGRSDNPVRGLVALQSIRLLTPVEGLSCERCCAVQYRTIVHLHVAGCHG